MTDPRARLQQGLAIVPHQFRGGVQLWVLAALRPGSFLCAVLANDLAAAVAYAGPGALEALPDIVHCLKHYCPAECWGAPVNVERWRELGGLDGIDLEPVEAV